MQAIKVVRKFIGQNPADPSARILARLVLALESEVDFAISDLYKLDFGHFNNALRMLEEWRLDRYHAGKAKLFDISLQVAEMQSGQ